MLAGLRASFLLGLAICTGNAVSKETECEVCEQPKVPYESCCSDGESWWTQETLTGKWFGATLSFEGSRDHVFG